MKKIFSLLLIISCLTMTLTGCGSSTKEINYDLDKEIEKITSPDLYPEELLDTKLQESLRNDAQNEELELLDADLIGYADADNKLPIEYMFDRNTAFYEAETVDWMGEKWTFIPYFSNYTSLVTGINFSLTFNPDDLDYAHRKINELNNAFLKHYGNIIFSSNVYEYSVENLKETPIELIASTEEAYIIYKVFYYQLAEETAPAIQIMFIDKEPVHDVSNNPDLGYQIEHLKTVVNKNTEEILLKTVSLSSSAGYVMDEPKSEENMTPEEQLIAGGVFYK